jgi:hypothetical protein
MAEHSITANRISRAFQPKQKEFARLYRTEIRGTAWLPKINLVNLWLSREKIKLIMIGVCHPQADHVTPPRSLLLWFCPQRARLPDRERIAAFLAYSRPLAMRRAPE